MDDLQTVMHINRMCLPENYSDYFFIDLARKFPETFIVAELKGEVVGYIMCRIETGLSGFSFGGLNKKGHIVSIAVMPEHRRHGIAKALIAKAFEGMHLANAKQCYLEVRMSNDAAVSLYRKLGFEITRTINGYYADGENADVMTKRL
jgi:ribosomal-protein-alanine N-acetyltransferase